MRAAILTLALLLTASGCPQEPTKQPTTSCHEEDPCWNCKTMGNRRCSSGETRAV